MGTAPSQSANTPPAALPASSHPDLSIEEAGLLLELWQHSQADSLGLSQAEFLRMMADLGLAQNYGQPTGTLATHNDREVFFRNLRLADLTLARACEQGSDLAWERFMALYRQPLTRAAIAIAGSDTEGREIADALYAELYGLATRDGQRRSPLASYKGRGSLLGWLRTTLAQRHIDRYRRTAREEPLEEAVSRDLAAPEPAPVPPQLTLLGTAVTQALAQSPPQDRYLLAAYYLNRRTLLQIAQLLRVHEATVSRKLHRLTDRLRKQVLKNLQSTGLSRRAAMEQLEADPRDLDLNLSNLLQSAQSPAFQERAAL